MAKTDRMQEFAEKVVDLDSSRHNVVAIIEQGGAIIAVGFNNMNKTHPVYFNGEFDRGVHAEFDALRQCRHKDLSGAAMYVFYFRRDGELGDSKPCDDCMREIENAKLRRVYFVDNGEIRRLTDTENEV